MNFQEEFVENRKMNYVHIQKKKMKLKDSEGKKFKKYMKIQLWLKEDLSDEEQW